LNEKKGSAFGLKVKRNEFDTNPNTSEGSHGPGMKPVPMRKGLKRGRGQGAGEREHDYNHQNQKRGKRGGIRRRRTATYLIYIEKKALQNPHSGARKHSTQFTLGGKGEEGGEMKESGWAARRGKSLIITSWRKGKKVVPGRGCRNRQYIAL